MGFLDFLCAHAQAEISGIDDDMTVTHECDYDKDPTNLYQAIESAAWIPVLEYFKTGQWDVGVLFGGQEDPVAPEIQARTWVTRFQEDGKVRWSQLPLHAAIIFAAPVGIVATLIELYPQGVRCTDDQHMLPLHLAIKFGAEDSVVRVLTESFPESLFTKDIRGRYPTQMDGTKTDRTKIMDEIINVTTKTLTKKHSIQMSEETAAIKEDMILQNKVSTALEDQKRKLEVALANSKAEIAILKGEVNNLKKKTVRDPAVAKTKEEKKTTRKKQEGTKEGKDPAGTRSVGGSSGSKRDPTSSKRDVATKRDAAANQGTSSKKSGPVKKTSKPRVTPENTTGRKKTGKTIVLRKKTDENQAPIQELKITQLDDSKEQKPEQKSEPKEEQNEDQKPVKKTEKDKPLEEKANPQPKSSRDPEPSLVLDTEKPEELLVDIAKAAVTVVQNKTKKKKKAVTPENKKVLAAE